MGDHITQSIIVKGALSDIYQMWADFQNFPRFMKNIKAVSKLDDRTSHWVMEGPLGTKIEWDAETTRMEENRRIAWNSKDNSAMKTSGQVTFKKLGPNETEITVTMHYDPPAGLAGEVVADLFTNPEGRVRHDLKRFKEHIESTASRLHESAPALTQ